MEVQALTRYARISPMKARDVARVIQGRPANEALELLRFVPRKAARLLSKTLQSAVANAENNHNLASDNLVIKSALIEEGPVFKRFRPGPRGMAKPYKKRTSHLRIILAERAPEPAETSAA